MRTSIHIILLVCYFLSSSLLLAQTPIRLQGIIIDAQNNRPMPFVYIIINEGVAVGNTDLNGKFDFSVNVSIEKVSFTHVGYENFVYEVRQIEDLKPLQRFLTIPLAPKTQTLGEIVLTQQNPAIPIIKQTLKNRNLHNPKKIPFYGYHSYNKFHVELEPTQNIEMPSPKDSNQYEMALFLKDNYLFLAETITKYQYLAPTFQYEKVIANRVSGFQNPQFVTLSTQGQILNFYEDYLEVLNRKYLNPISEKSWERYEFTLEDTVLIQPDTLYWISFEPLPHKNFDGLKGRIAIHTRTYAIQSMEIASALPESEVGLGFRLEQQYEWIDKQYWFAKQVRTELIFRKLKIGNRRMIAQWQTNFSDFDFKTKPRLRDFRDVSLEVAPDAHTQNAEFWASYRIDSLNKKEKNTYLNIDSLGRQAKLDESLLLSQALTFGRVPIKNSKVDFDFLHSFNFNRYEFIRIGGALITNDAFSKRFALGANLAYGTRDGNFKYGFLAQYRPFNRLDATLTARYLSDVIEPARVRFLEENVGIVLAPNRDFFISRMDKVRRFELKAQARILQNIRLGAIFSTQRVLPTYHYSFSMMRPDGSLGIYTDRYQITELNFQLQYLFGAQYVRMGNMRSLAAITLPAVFISYTQGMRAFGSDFRYAKWEARALYEKTFLHLGTTQGEIWLGFSKGAIPYQALWNGQGTGRTVPPMIPNYFQTMGTYEFLTDKFVYIFLRHNFRKLLYKSPYKWFQPEPTLHHNFGWGDLRNPDSHIGSIETNTLKKGYWESGVMINNLLKFKYLGAIKIGLGGGAFYRYGAYRNRESFGKNWAYKFSLNISI